MMSEILGILQHGHIQVHNFIFQKWVSRSMSKSTIGERTLIKSVVATLSIKAYLVFLQLNLQTLAAIDRY